MKNTCHNVFVDKRKWTYIRSKVINDKKVNLLIGMIQKFP